MSRSKKLIVLPFSFLVLGFLARWCRGWLYAHAIDGKGLLMPHPIGWGLLALTAAAALAALLLTRNTQVEAAKGIMPAIGSGFLALTMAVQSLNMEAVEELRMVTLNTVFSWAAVGCAVLLAICRIRKKQPHFGLYAALCLFYCIHQVLCYQLWSHRPQMQDYWFSLGAVLSTILFCYGQAAQVLGVKHSRFQGAIGLFGIFCCCAAFARCEFPVLYAGTALFLITELNGLTERKETAV